MKTVAIFFLVLFVVTGVSAQGVNSEAQLKSVPSVSYPAEASNTGLEGTVRVAVNIDEKGMVTKVGEAYGPDFVCPKIKRTDVVVMREISRKSAEKALFIPAMKKGKPVSSQIWLEFEFKDPSPKKSASLKSGVEAIDSDGKTVSGSVLNGRALSLPRPVFPSAASAIKLQGTVDVQLLIDTDGTVFSAEATSGHPLLRSAARDAACKARFSPTLLNGMPVIVSGIVTYNFN